MDSLVLKSPAKLNLFLNILKKRPDGFHDLETLFERISLFDTIRIKSISASSKIQIKCSHPHVPIG
ncbi:4-diphosphocytidyl-2-C-methyl-D-erythritol kinase, partial [hydrothermal vent metagenome]